MPITNHILTLDTQGEGETHNLTPDIENCLTDSGLRSGAATVFVPGSTAGLTTIEFEPGAVADLATAFERIAPRQADYEHNARWGDMNGFSHVRAALLGPSLVIPFVDRKLLLGTWQQIILVDFDNRPRHRQVHCQLNGA